MAVKITDLLLDSERDFSCKTYLMVPLCKKNRMQASIKTLSKNVEGCRDGRAKNQRN